HTDTRRADPSHAGHAYAQFIEDRLGLWRVIVAQITPAQREREGFALHRATCFGLGLNLPQALGQGHAPVGVGSMSLDKGSERHSRTSKGEQNLRWPARGSSYPAEPHAASRVNHPRLKARPTSD